MDQDTMEDIVKFGAVLIVGTLQGVILGNLNKKKAVKEAKLASFEDGIKEGKKMTVDELRKRDDFWLASAALSVYIATCDGNLTDEELDEISYDLDPIFKNAELADSLLKKLEDILKKNLTFNEVVTYLDKVSVETLENLQKDVDEIIMASDGINEAEARARAQFQQYLKGRKNESNK